MSGCHLYLRWFLLFWFVVMSLLSSWDEMDIHVKLLADDVWAAEDDITGFLSVEVDILNKSYFKDDQFPCPRWKLVL